MVLAAKENPFLNCLSEPPAAFEEKEEEPVVEEAAAQEFPYVEEPVSEPARPEEPAEETGGKEGEKKEPGIWDRLRGRSEDRKRERDEEKRRKEEENERRRRKIVWKNPLDSFTKKVGSAVGKIIDDGYDGMEE